MNLLVLCVSFCPRRALFFFAVVLLLCVLTFDFGRRFLSAQRRALEPFFCDSVTRSTILKRRPITGSKSIVDEEQSQLKRLNELIRPIDQLSSCLDNTH